MRWMWELDHKEGWVLSICGAGEDSWGSLGLRGDQTSQSERKSTLECSLEGLMLKLKLQYFGYLIQRADTLEKTLMLGKIEGRRRRGWQRVRWLDGITDSIDLSFSKLWGIVKDRESWQATVHGFAEAEMTEWLNDNVTGDQWVSFFSGLFLAPMSFTDLKKKKKKKSSGNGRSFVWADPQIAFNCRRDLSKAYTWSKDFWSHSE